MASTSHTAVRNSSSSPLAAPGAVSVNPSPSVGCSPANTMFKLNWMQWSEQGDHWDIYNSKLTYCDVTIACSDGCLLAHSSILSLDSFFVKNLLKDATPGALGTPGGVVLHLPDWSKLVVRQLLSILYNGSSNVANVSDSAKVSKLGRMLGYNVHKWQLLPSQGDAIGAVQSPIKSLAATGTTMSVVRRPPPSLNPVSSLATTNNSKLSKFLAEKQQQLTANKTTIVSTLGVGGGSNGLETLAETSSVTISRIPCISQSPMQQGKSTPTKNLIAASASAGCQTINTSTSLSSTTKDPLALTPPGATHPSVPTIRVKSGLRLNDRDAAITLTPSGSGSSPPGLCKIGTGSSGVTANSRPLQDILSSCGRVLTVRSLSSGTGTKILTPNVGTKSTTGSESGKGGRHGPSKHPVHPPPLLLAPPPLLVKNSQGQQRLQVQGKPGQKGAKVAPPPAAAPVSCPLPNDDEEEVSLDSMLECMIKEESLDDDELMDDLEEENAPSSSSTSIVAATSSPMTSIATLTPVGVKIITTNAAGVSTSTSTVTRGGAKQHVLVVPPPPQPQQQPNDEPPALIVHPASASKVQWNHPDPNGWSGSSANKTNSVTAATQPSDVSEPGRSDGNKEQAQQTSATTTTNSSTSSHHGPGRPRRGRKRRRLLSMARRRKQPPIKLRIKPVTGEDGVVSQQASAIPAEEEAGHGEEEEEVDEGESEAEVESEADQEREQMDDSDEDWDPASSKQKRKKSAERRSPRLRTPKDKNNKGEGHEKEDEQAAAATVEEANESSEAESEDGVEAEEINPNIAKVAVGASYDSFKDFQVAFQRYCAENCACMKMIRRHLLQGHGDKFPVHEITYSCGAIKRRRGDNNKDPNSSCPAMLHCKFNATLKKYVIAKLEQNHTNHPVTRDAYDSYMKKKELTPHERKVALKLLNSGKDPETVCKIMNRVTGKTISVEYLSTITF